MTFKEAKQIIRAELALASDEKITTLIDVARAGKVPWASDCCLATRLFGFVAYMNSKYGSAPAQADLAYLTIGWNRGDHCRNRILTVLCLSELRSRMRARELAAITEVHSIAELVR